MTPTEDDLHDTLRLLEQRAPEHAPDVPAGATPSRRPAAVARASAAAAAVLVIAGGAALLAVHRNDARPAQKHGPIATPVGTPHPLPFELATLRVRVTLFGGPAGGGTDGSGQAVSGTRVTVIGIGDGRGAYRSQLQITSTANRLGVATFAVAPGRYRYRSSVCGSGFGHHAAATLRAGHTETVQISCAGP